MEARVTLVDPDQNLLRGLVADRFDAGLHLFERGEVLANGVEIERPSLEHDVAADVIE